MRPGRVDLICYPLQVLFEIKTKGEASPTKPSVKPNETQHQQVERYLKRVVPPFYNPKPGSRLWRGFLTDGQKIWGWQWDDVGNTL